MTDNEIIKALECLMHDNCEDCPYYRDDCADRIKDPIELSKYALDLINRQQAEIERLKSMNQAKLDTIHDLQAEIEQWKEEANKYQKLWCIAIDDVDDIETVTSEAIKEFAERLKEKVENARKKYQRLCKEQGEKEDEAMNIHFKGIIKLINNLVKEKVG